MRRCQNPGIARKVGGGGSDPCQDFLVDLIKCTKAKIYAGLTFFSFL